MEWLHAHGGHLGLSMLSHSALVRVEESSNAENNTKGAQRKKKTKKKAKRGLDFAEGALHITHAHTYIQYISYTPGCPRGDTHTHCHVCE